MSILKRCFPITCATCSPGCFTVSRRILPSLLTFSVTQVLTPHESTSFPPAWSTAAGWKICTRSYEKSRQIGGEYIIRIMLQSFCQHESLPMRYTATNLQNSAKIQAFSIFVLKRLSFAVSSRQFSANHTFLC